MRSDHETPSWAPFHLAAPGAHADAPRSIRSPQGIGDRLRATAFAELQAREAFQWAAERFTDAPESLRTAWRGLSAAEDRHLGWLLARIEVLGVNLAERKVSDLLWASFMKCQTAKEFALYMANAEERGRQAGERFAQQMKSVDPVTAEIFGRIAEEEVEHIRLAHRYYPTEDGTHDTQKI